MQPKNRHCFYPYVSSVALLAPAANFSGVRKVCKALHALFWMESRLDSTTSLCKAVADPKGEGEGRMCGHPSPLEPLCTSKHFISSAKPLINKFMHPEND